MLFLLSYVFGVYVCVFLYLVFILGIYSFDYRSNVGCLGYYYTVYSETFQYYQNIEPISS